MPGYPVGCILSCGPYGEHLAALAHSHGSWESIYSELFAEERG